MVNLRVSAVGSLAVPLCLTATSLAGMFPHCVQFDSSDYDSRILQLVDSTFAERNEANKGFESFVFWSPQRVILKEVARFPEFHDLLLFYWDSERSGGADFPPLIVNTRLNKGYLFVAPPKAGSYAPLDMFDLSFQRLVRETGMTIVDDDDISELMALYFATRKAQRNIKVVYREHRDLDRLNAFQNISDEDFNTIFGFFREFNTWSYYQPFLIWDFSKVPPFESQTPEDILALTFHEWWSEFDFCELVPPSLEIRGDTVNLSFDVLFASFQTISMIKRYEFKFTTDLSYFLRRESKLYETF